MRKVKTIERDIEVWGHKLKIVDEEWSVSVDFIERDMREDSHGILSLPEAPKTILDLGANVGIWSIAVAKQFPEAHVFAVEPTHYNYKNLLTNCELNKVPQVTGFDFAVSGDTDGTLTLYQHPRNSGSVSFFLPYEGMKRVDVKCVTLDTLLSRLPPIDFLKVDIEGMEYQLFNNFKSWDKVKKISIESHILPLCGDNAHDVSNIDLNNALIEKFYYSLLQHKPAQDICMQGQNKKWVWGKEMEIHAWQKPQESR